MIEHIRFPGVTLRSAEDFRRFEAEHRDLLDERLRQEMLFVKQGRLAMEGTCGVCLSVTRFTSESATSQGRYARDQQLCGCDSKLPSRSRALLHFAAPSFGGAGWFRLGFFGRDEALLRTLSASLPPAWIWLDAEAPNEQPTASTHMVLSADALATVPSQDEALASVAQTLLPGGLFIFTIPFDPHATASQDRPPRLCGWDILDRVRTAGFLDCTAHHYWSAELGLLGPHGIIFKASR